MQVYVYGSNKHIIMVFRAAVEELLQEAKKAEAARHVMLNYISGFVYTTELTL